jgi:hypothetical protein
VAHVRLTNMPDRFVWDLLQNGVFTVNSMYYGLSMDNQVECSSLLWNLNIPHRIKIFLWYLRRWVVLTKNNLARRNWHGCKQCVFYMHLEIIKHLFFDCHFARFLWWAVQVFFNISIPTSMEHLFSDWTNSVGRLKRIILMGAAALYWTMWIS